MTKENIKRLLFLSFFFPPIKSVACVRTLSIAKYLTRLGWEVTVVTPHPKYLQEADNINEVSKQLDRLGIKRIYTGHTWCFLTRGYIKRTYCHGVKWFIGGLFRKVIQKIGIDDKVGWYSEIEKTCSVLMPGSFDIILASGDPFGSFKIANRLSKRLGCPYVLDYRDLWHGNPHCSTKTILKKNKLESRLIRESFAVSVVSPSIKKYIDIHYGAAEKVHVITNGFDPDEYVGVIGQKFDHFTIVYAGHFYPPKRVISPVMQALNEISKDKINKPWKFHYYGPHDDHVRESALNHHVLDHTILHGKVSRLECLEALAGADVVVVITSVFESSDLADRGLITGKIYEPIALGTPILVLAPEGSDVEKIVRTTGNGTVINGNNIYKIKKYIEYRMFNPKKNCVRSDAFSWSNISLQLNNILKQLK